MPPHLLEIIESGENIDHLWRWVHEDPFVYEQLTLRWVYGKGKLLLFKIELCIDISGVPSRIDSNPFRD